MAALEELKPGASLLGVSPDGPVTVVQVAWFGASAVELTYKNPDGRLRNELLYRSDEGRLEVVEDSRAWSFDGDGTHFSIVAEAQRIRFAHLFDPMLAVHTSAVEALPHQITAVYEDMLPRQPLRFLLADDPGAGKTIMAGLLIKELIARGDLTRCLVVCPGSLVEQWQDELRDKFQLPFEIATNDKLNAAASGNWFLETDLAIARLDKLARDDDAQAKLQAPECRWDLIVCDEAHKMSASFFGGEVKRTKRYNLGQTLSSLTRHLLLMTATPHNGKEEDFQLFLALLDGDRFEGRFRDGVHQVDTSDLMRRMVKENLLRFDGKQLFPERIAYTVPYSLSEAEARLYGEVTNYVRQEFNRADALEDDNRKRNIGFALTILQRRLASSPAAIHESLRRRRKRLEERRREIELQQGGVPLDPKLRLLDEDELGDFDDAPDIELTEAGDLLIGNATAAGTLTELKAEIASLRQLERLAAPLRREGDTKWGKLSAVLSDEIFTSAGVRQNVAEDSVAYGPTNIPRPTASRDQKVVIFTEHRDTLDYLREKIAGVLTGRGEAVEVIHGNIGREDRRKAQERFLNDPGVRVLLATDAASEGINLQRAHLMINYDLPWNPNRIEQRFGRIHRIGQTKVCHLWNLVATQTREGDVYRRLLDKLEQARQSLGGQVFDVLGKLEFEGKPLRDLLREAIRYGDSPEVRARLDTVVDGAVDEPHLRSLLADHALSPQLFDTGRVDEVREEMERAHARRLQPYYVAAFFRDAFAELGGRIYEREPRRYEITHVPVAIRKRDRIIGSGPPVLQRYERVAFERERIQPSELPRAEFLCPGHPLLDAVLDLTLERHRDLLRRGTVLVDDEDPGVKPRVVFAAEHSVQDQSALPSGERRTISQRMLYVQIDADGRALPMHYAPYLDFRALSDDEPAAADILTRPECAWIAQQLEQAAVDYAVAEIAPEHLEEVRSRRLALVRKTRDAVRTRLTTEINHWDHRAQVLKEDEAAGKTNAKLNAAQAQQTADDLADRLEHRLEELDREEQVSAKPPEVIGGFVIVPAGLLARINVEDDADTAADSAAADTAPAATTDRMAAAARARDAVMRAEQELGNDPTDVEFQKRGYDIESRGRDGHLRFIEVKGRIAGADTVTVTRNEILHALNEPDRFILAVVELPADATDTSPEPIHYMRRPFFNQLDEAAVSTTFKLADLLKDAEPPA